MAQLGSKKRPAVVKVQTEQRAMEIMAICQAKGWQVIVGIEPDEVENIDDIKNLEKGSKSLFTFQTSPPRNAACPCGSGKQYKRCCGQ